MKKKSYKRIHDLINMITVAEKTYEKNINFLCEKLRTLSVKEDYPYGIAFAWTHLSRYSILDNQKDEAKFYLKKAIEYNEKYHFIELQIECKNLQGLYYKSINNTYEVFLCYLEGVELAKNTRQLIAVAMFYNNLALILLELGNYDSAKTYLLESLRFTSNSSSSKRVLYQKLIYSNLIAVAYFLNNKHEAKEYLNAFNQIEFDNNKIEMNTLCNQILVKTLEHKKHEIIELAYQFVDRLKDYDANLFSLECGMVVKVLIQIRHQELAKDILQFLFKESQNEGRDRLQYLKLRIEYNEEFNLDDKQVYIDFYDAVEAIESNERYLLIEGLKSNIHMFMLENEKQSLSKKRRYLESKVEIDELTGLYNRHFFNKLISRGNKIKSATSFICIMMDLDYFKQYNDVYGHVAGDSVLKMVGECLNKYALPNMYPCRYGGDEFTCLCYGISQEAVNTYIANVQNMLKKYSIVHEKKRVNAYVTMTFGSYCAKTDLQKEPSFYIALADKALYQAKNKKRGSYVKLGDNIGVYE